MNADRESAEPRRLAVDIVYAMPADPSEADLEAFRKVVNLPDFYAEVRQMLTETETEHDIEETAA